jgi:type II secretory pathway pseudopilin PulG
MWTFQRRRAYTLVETLTVLALVSSLVLATSVGLRTVRDTVEADRASASVTGVLAAQELHHRRFGSFTTDGSQLDDLLSGITLSDGDPSSHPETVAMALGSYTTPSGPVGVVVAVAATAEWCVWGATAEPTSRVDRWSGTFQTSSGSCDPSVAVQTWQEQP